MNWKLSTILAVSLLVPCFCDAQWYEGPSGGQGGKPFDHWKETNGARDIATFSVLQDSQIRSISVTYRDRSLFVCAGFCNAPPGELSFNGGRGIKLAPDEYIIGIAGRYGDHIDSLRIYTNKTNSPVWGGNGGKVDFGYTAPQGQMIVGFFGRAGDSIDAIGVLYAPCTPQKKPCR